jgi:hypothetical protein
VHRPHRERDAAEREAGEHRTRHGVPGSPHRHGGDCEHGQRDEQDHADPAGRGPGVAAGTRGDDGEASDTPHDREPVHPPQR